MFKHWHFKLFIFKALRQVVLNLRIPNCKDAFSILIEKYESLRHRTARTFFSPFDRACSISFPERLWCERFNSQVTVVEKAREAKREWEKKSKNKKRHAWNKIRFQDYFSLSCLRDIVGTKSLFGRKKMKDQELRTHAVPAYFVTYRQQLCCFLCNVKGF